MNNLSILTKIDLIVEVLATQVTVAETKDGWTQQSKDIFKVFFEDLRDKLQRAEEIPPLSISRATDTYGIMGGDTLELAAQISNEIRKRTGGV